MSTPSSSQFTTFVRNNAIASNPTSVTTSVSGVTQFLSSLSNKNGTQPLTGWTKVDGMAGSQIKYLNGYWVTLMYDIETPRIALYYTDDPTLPWKKSTPLPVGSGASTGSFGAASFTYGNGYWVIVGGDSSGNITYNHIYYATSLTGTWNPVEIISTPGSHLNDITYANGYFVTVGHDADYDQTIWYATDPTQTSNWQSHTAFEAYYFNPPPGQGADGEDGGGGIWITGEANSIAYGNGYWVAVGYDGTRKKNVWYATDPTGPWTGIENGPFSFAGVVDGAINPFYQCNTVKYINNYWVLTGYNIDEPGQLVYYTQDPRTWTLLDRRVFENDGLRTPQSFRDIAYGNGYWVIVGSGGRSVNAFRVFYSTSLTGPWTGTTKAFPPPTRRNQFSNGSSIDYANGYFVAVGTGMYYAVDPTY